VSYTTLSGRALGRCRAEETTQASSAVQDNNAVTHNSKGGDGVDAVRVGTNAETLSLSLSLSLSLYTVIASVQPPLSDTARDGDIGGLMKQRRVDDEGGRGLSDATISLSVCLSVTCRFVTTRRL